MARLTPASELKVQSDINATWLNRLRWFAIAGQIGTISIAAAFTSARLPLSNLAIVVAFEIAFALVTDLGTRRGALQGSRALLATMIVDVLILTALLYFAGGPENPFNFLYLVHVTLALVAIGEAGAWTLLVLSSALFGLLFFWHTPLYIHGADAHSTMRLHMQGMWVGFVVAAVSVVTFMSRLSRAVKEREAQLSEATRRAQNAERMAALATLAAGAAHELNTPLSTIALVSKELEHSARDAGEPGESMLEDARLIRSEVERCRSILEQLSVDAGHATGSPEAAVRVGEMLECDALQRDDVQLHIADDLADVVVHVALRPVRLALSAVCNNARAAGPGPVDVNVASQGEVLVIEVADTGAGMSPEVLSKAFDPFFTTRTTGRGMGLGLFLARGVAEAVGGELTLSSSEGDGTCATFRLPILP